MTEVVEDDQGRVKLSSVPLKHGGLTILCHRDEIDVVNDLPNIMEITPEMTLEMAAKFTERTWAMAKLDADFKRRLAIVYPDLDITTDKRTLAQYPIGIRHVVGLIIQTNKAINTGRRPWWKFPETYLHPSTQANIASLAISYTKDGEAEVGEKN